MKPLTRPICALFPVLLFTAAAQAGTIWDGGGSDNLWTTPDNWDPNGAPVPASTVDLTFSGTTRLISINNFAALEDFHSILFSPTAGAFELSGNAIDLFGRIENQSAALQTIALDLAVQSGETGTGEIHVTNGDLLISSANVFTNTNTIQVFGANNRTVTFSGVISQDGGLSINEATNVVLTGANTYTGATNILAGSLTVGNGGTNGTLGSGSVSNNASLVFNRSDAFTVANAIGGSGVLTKRGNGVLTLSGTNSFSGPLIIGAGGVVITSAAAAGSPSQIVLGDASTGAANVAYTTTGTSIARPITVSADGTGTVTIGTANAGTTVNPTFSGLITLNRPTTLTAGTTDRTTWAGQITGNVGTLTIAGGQRTVLNNSANNFAGDIVVTGANTILQTGVATGTEHLPDGSSLTVQAGALFKLAGAANSIETINALNGAGIVRRHEGVTGLQTLVIGSADGSGTFTGPFQNGGGSLAIRKVGAGTQVVGSVGNAASGGVTVNGGVLRLTGVAGFNVGSFAGATVYTINTGGTLEVQGDWLTNNVSTYNVNGGTLAFTKATGDLTLSYVNILNLTDGLVAGPASFRTGFFGNPTITVTGSLGSTISSGVSLLNDVDLTGVRVLTFSVADGAADNDLLITGVVADLPTHRGEKITKTGNGRLVFAGNNTYSGTTTISAGTLQIGNGGGTGLPGTGAIVNDATLVFNRSSPVILANGISGTGTLTQAGAGAVTLTGALSYTGATAVNAGKLVVNSTLNTSVVSVNNGGTLGGTGTFGEVVLNAGGSIEAGSSDSGILTVDQLKFEAGSTSARFVAGNTSVVASNLTANGTTTLNVTGTMSVGNSYTLLDYSGVIGGNGFPGFVLGTLPARVVAQLINNLGNTSIDLSVTAVDRPKWTGAVDGLWNTTVTNWKEVTSGNITTYLEADNVLFDDSATGVTNVILDTTINPSAVTVNTGTIAYSISGSGAIAGSTSLVKTGSSMLTISTANSFTGTPQLNGGVVSVPTIADSGVNSPLGAASTVSFDGGTLEFTGVSGSTNREMVMNGIGGNIRTTGTLVLTGAISGPGQFTKSGAGTVRLPVANTHTGGTVISSGTLVGEVNNAFGPGAITLGDASTGSNPVSLYLANRADIPNAIVVSADGTGPAVLGADNSGTGANAASFLGPVTLNRPTTLSGEVAADRLAMDGPISGNVGLLTVTGGSRTTFRSTLNDFTGNILITGTGTILQSGVATPAETIPNGSSITVEAGAILQLAGSGAAVETIDGLSGAGTVQTFPTLVAAIAEQTLVVGSAGGGGNFSGVLQNGFTPLAFTKLGVGTQILSGANPYTGPTVISAGVLALTGSLSGTPSIAVQAGATFDVSGVAGGYFLAPGQTLSGEGAIAGAATIGGVLSPGLFSGSPGTLTFNQTVTFDGAATTLVDLLGAAPGLFDRVVGMSNPVLDGVIVVGLGGGFEPVLGDSFDLLDWSGNLNSTGFDLDADLFLPALSGGNTWNRSEFLTTGTLSVVPEPSGAALLLCGLAVFAARRRRA